MIKSPCLKCERRTPDCHGKCADYAEWKITRKSPKSNAAYGRDAEVNAYLTDRVNRRGKR